MRTRKLRRLLRILPEAVVYLFCGRLEEVKGVDVLLSAWEEVEEEGENSYLLVLGTGTLEKRVQALAEKSCRVRAVGQVGETTLYYRAADVFLLPSRYEGTSLSLLEAMACGLAVVATDTGDTARVVGEGEAGLLIPPEDVTALVEAMLRLGREEDLRCRLGQAAREKVEKEYSLRLMMDRYEKLLLLLKTGKRKWWSE